MPVSEFPSAQESAANFAVALVDGLIEISKQKDQEKLKTSQQQDQERLKTSQQQEQTVINVRSASDQETFENLGGTGLQKGVADGVLPFPNSVTEVPMDDVTDPSSLEAIRKEKKMIEKEKEKQKAIQKMWLAFGGVATALSIITWFPVTIEAILNPAITCGLNLWQYLIAFIANILWIVYAAGIRAWPLLVSSVAVVILLIIILSIKYMYAEDCDEQETEEPEINTQEGVSA